jgi:hypothetical protein
MIKIKMKTIRERRLATKIKYNKSAKGLAAQKRYLESKKGKASRKRIGRLWWENNKEKCAAAARKSRLKVRLECLRAYSGPTPKCQCKCGCKEDRVKLLEVAHLDQNGASHRKEIGGSQMLCWWLRKNNFPTGFAILCPTCHAAKDIYGRC